MRRYWLGAHTKTDLRVHFVWIPKNRKRVLRGEVVVRTRDLLRQIAIEHEIEIITRNVSADHINMIISYKLAQNISKVVQCLKGFISRILLAEKTQDEGAHLAKALLALELVDQDTFSGLIQKAESNSWVLFEIESALAWVSSVFLRNVVKTLLISGKKRCYYSWTENLCVAL